MRVNNNKNILLFTTTLMNGGAEVFLSNLKPVLELLGFNVYVMVNNSFDQSTYSSEYYSLHEKNFNFLKPLRLKKFLKEHEIDLIIDNRARLNLFKTTVYECVFGSTKKIKIIHSYHIHSYLFKNKTINKLLFTHYSKIVCVSKAIENLVKKNTGLLNTIHIPNFTPITESDETININFPYILFYGRFDNVSKENKFSIDISTAEAANQTLKNIDYAINKVSMQRSSFGATQNRLEYTMNNLETTEENLTAAESRIRDVDMAEEIMNFTKQSMINKVAISMLSQANSQAQNVLSLLGGL